MRGTPVEIAETQTPLIFWRKEFRPDSAAPAAPAAARQIIEIESGIAEPFDLLAAFDRIDYPPRGRDGGRDGEAGFVGLKSGQTDEGQGLPADPAGRPAGGDDAGRRRHRQAGERDRVQVANDLADGLISQETAEEDLRLQGAERRTSSTRPERNNAT